ncbi:MAG: transglycosylase domain-containing protein, partial [Eubacteriales bacterium]|nr:transglycosylase domain-containing protein [Eubacteriales bacterium]
MRSSKYKVTDEEFSSRIREEAAGNMPADQNWGEDQNHPIFDEEPQYETGGRHSMKGGGHGGGHSGGRKPKRKMKGWKRVLLTILLIFLILFLGVFVYAVITIANAPKIDTGKIYSILNQSSTIYDMNGKKVEQLYTGSKRTNVKYDKLPKNLVNAYVALEDKTFWKHHGFNYIRILGAIKESVLGGGSVSGTSTLTQQLARNVFLSESMYTHSMKRKIIEAWYTVKLEHNLTKQQIAEAYMNTIALGFNTNGVQAASEAYFGKSVQKLSLAQMATLASLPQAPTTYAPVQMVKSDAVSTKAKNILKRTSDYTYVYNEACVPRRNLCLKLMQEQGYITEKEYKKAVSTSLRSELNPDYSNTNVKYSYFTDYVVDQVTSDLEKKYNISHAEALQKIYTGGMKIHTTLNQQAQRTVEREFKNSANFPVPTNIRYDGQGNILSNKGTIVMYDYNDFFGTNGDFTFKTDEAKVQKNGSILIKANKRLKIYRTQANNSIDFSIEFPTMYVFRNGQLYSINGGNLNIPQKYKSSDASGNIIVSRKYRTKDGKGILKVSPTGTITITKNGYTLNQRNIQPQAAMTIIENSTGEVKAMVGGRDGQGRMLYNRATSTRQPGSSIKPLAVYSAALEQSAEEAEKGVAHTFTNYGIDQQGTSGWGNYITAGSTVYDERTTNNGTAWPQNSGGGYSGYQTLRTALRGSINTCAYKIFMQVGATYSANMVKKYGITTLDTKGNVSDLNAAALALGGMTKGVSTLEMANAYTTFPNNGTKTKKPICYTSIRDSDGKTILKADRSRTRVLKQGVAWIMTDLLKGVVSGGTGTAASVPGVTVAGKTGTTSDEFDLWFDGFTPNYTGALWMGNDVNITLSGMSSYSARLWGRIMSQIPEAKKGAFKSMPSDVEIHGSEYYETGTYGGSTGYAGSTNGSYSTQNGQQNTTTPNGNTQNNNTQNGTTGGTTGGTGGTTGGTTGG